MFSYFSLFATVLLIFLLSAAFIKEFASNSSLVFVFIHDTAQESVMNALGSSLFHDVVNQT
jgi:hypothetical protein